MRFHCCVFIFIFAVSAASERDKESTKGKGKPFGKRYAGNYESPDDVHIRDERYKTITITKKVRVPYPVTVEKRIPVPVKVHVKKPYPVFIHKPYPVHVTEHVPYPVKVPVPQPYPVEKEVHVPVEVPVEKPVHVEKPVPVIIEKEVPYTIEKEVQVPIKVYVEKPVYYPIEKPVPYPVPVPYDVGGNWTQQLGPVQFPMHRDVYLKVPYHVKNTPIHIPVRPEEDHHSYKDGLKSLGTHDIQEGIRGLSYGAENLVQISKPPSAPESTDELNQFNEHLPNRALADLVSLYGRLAGHSHYRGYSSNHLHEPENEENRRIENVVPTEERNERDLSDEETLKPTETTP